MMILCHLKTTRIFQFQSFSISPDGQIVSAMYKDAKYSIGILRLDVILNAEVC